MIPVGFDMDESAERENAQLDDLDVAVAHWHVNAWGGAEYLVTKLAEAVGTDTVYTLGTPDPESENPYGDVVFEDVTPALDYPRIRRLQRRADRVFEYAQWEDIDWREYDHPDVVITSGATTRAVITPDDTLHVNYCHSPPRLYYDLYHDRKNAIEQVISRPLVRYLRMRDQTLDPRVDHYFVNSPIIERRLWKYYKRDSEVLYPPVDVDEYYNEGDEGYYLHLGRLDVEKGVPALVEAFVGTNHRLIMAGGRGDVSGTVIETIEDADNIEWLGFVKEEEKFELLANCRAVVFNGRNEDFGIVPVEGNASGKPVLARDEGFQSVFIADGENGLLHEGSAKSIATAVERLEANGIDGRPQEFVDEFAQTQFEARLRECVSSWADRPPFAAAVNESN